MNIHTFRDAVTSKRTALADEVDQDDEDDDEKVVAPMRRVVEGEEDEGKEKFDEMGVLIEPFNLRNERESGYFDENMNYVFKKEKGEIDAWLADLDEATVEAAIGEAAAAEKRIAEKRKLEEELDAKKPAKTIQELKEELLSYMIPEESIAATLRRLSGKQDNGARNVRRKDAHSDTSTTYKKLTAKEQNERSKLNRPIMDRITEIADELISKGLSGIYDMKYESIAASTVLWEYKGLDGVIYGPYTSEQIAGWKAQGYLTGDTAVMVRKVKPRTQQTTFSTDIYGDDDLEDTQPSKKIKVEQEKANDVDWVSSDDIDFGNFIDLDKVRFDKAVK